MARYLRLRDLQREVEEGLNVMESSNGANSVIAYGKGGEIASNRRDEQEMFVLCLRILQSALVYVNTLMLQDVMDDPEWADLLTPADRRGLTPLFWSHVRPYGEVNLNMAARLNLASASVPGPALRKPPATGYPTRRHSRGLTQQHRGHSCGRSSRSSRARDACAHARCMGETPTTSSTRALPCLWPCAAGAGRSGVTFGAGRAVSPR
ncbi:Tn3 family transposase [Streptomyces sp. NPDC054770]